MKYSIDRIEDGVAVLISEQGDELKKPVGEFPFEPAEGMLVSVGKCCTRRLKARERAEKRRLGDKLRRMLKRHAR